MIRKRLFPEWAEAEHWTLVLGHHPDYPKQLGLCVPLQHRLFVAPASTLLKWQLVLVHEICHAISGTPHGPDFQRCLSGAAHRAEQVGESELAAALRREAAPEA